MMVHSKTFQKLIISSLNCVTFYHAGKIKELFCLNYNYFSEMPKNRSYHFIEKLFQWSIWKGFHKGIQFDAILSKHICTHRVNYYYTALIFLLERSKVLSLKFAMMTTSYVWILSRGMSNNKQTKRSPYMEHDDFYVSEIPLKQCTIFIFQDFYNLWQTIILIGYKTRYEVLCIATALSLDLNKSSCSWNAKSHIHQVN